MYRWLKVISCLLLTSNLSAQYVYENNQDLYDLNANANNFEGELAYSVSDDGISPAIDLSFDFSFYGSTFSQARMATNGCLHFGSSGSYCNDYTPDPINGQHTYTIYPFWTDLIRDSGSRMKSYGDSDKMIFGWYNLREYNRASDNSFEVILWNNNSFDLRYRELDIINHDVLIGEVGANKDNSYTYYYHDECSTGTTNSSACVNTNWNATAINTTLENGGSLYGSGSGNGIDCSNPLNDSSCSGYADAYQTQQCNITQLYNESCPLYWEAYDDLQCALDPQYGPFCQGYRQEDSIAYFQEEEYFDYGYEEEDFGYEEEPVFEEFVFEFEEQYFEEPIFIFEEEIIFEQLFSQEEYYEPLEIMHELPMHDEEVFLPIEDIMIEEFIFQETFLVEDFREPETFIELETIEELEEWFEEETAMEEELAHAEEPAEEPIEEPVEEEETVEEIEEEVIMAAEGKSSISKEMALNVVSSTLATAQASVSGTTAGTSVHSTGNSAAAGNAVSSSSNSGISTSSSPSMSDQFASSTAQTNQVLDMSSTSISDTSISTSTVETETTTNEVVVTTVATISSQDNINISVNSVSTDSDTDTTVENIIAENLQNAQEDVQAQQEETGEYGSENAIIAVMGFVPGFNNYRLVRLPEKEVWYEPKSIYTTNTIQDNTAAFYQLAGTNIRTLTKLKEMQPTF
tara:strand:+ start:107 stop:2170 length:2064 start_codon:yes stop_codon:yes gene_type:complete